MAGRPTPPASHGPCVRLATRSAGSRPLSSPASRWGQVCPRRQPSSVVSGWPSRISTTSACPTLTLAAPTSSMPPAPRRTRSPELPPGASTRRRPCVPPTATPSSLTATTGRFVRFPSTSTPPAWNSSSSTPELPTASSTVSTRHDVAPARAPAAFLASPACVRSATSAPHPRGRTAHGRLPRLLA